MAQLVLTNAKVQLNGNDISTSVKSVTINYSAALQDNTAMGETTMSRLAGLKDWSIDLQLYQDYAAAALDSILFPLVGTSFTVLINPVNASNSTSNPQFSGSAFLESYNPITGAVGVVAETAVKLTGTATLSRLTS